MVSCPLRRMLLRWTGWFFLVNTFISVLIQVSYLHFLTNLDSIAGATISGIILAWFFLMTSYIAHAALLNFGAALIPALIALVIPRKRLIFPTAFILAAILIIAELIDRITFSIFHMHALGEVWIIFKTNSLPQVLPLSSLEISLFVTIILLVLLVEAVIGFFVLRVVKRKPGHKAGFIATATIAVMILFSYTIMSSVAILPEPFRFNEAKSHLILRMARLVPFYRDLYNLIIFGQHHQTRTVSTNEGDIPIQILPRKDKLHYPLKPLQCRPPRKPYNILLIVVDTWRKDSMTKTVTPNIYRFAKHAWQFDNNWSGGNCTKTGIFSLFYGIPANYWTAMLHHRRSPLLIDLLKKQHYQINLLASATLRFPQFEKTVFTNVHNIKQTPGNSTTTRDREITRRFLHQINHRKVKQPFFTFMFYDAMHNYCEGSEKEHQKPFKPAIKDCARYALTTSTNPKPYINRYHNAGHFIDHEIGKVLRALKLKHLDKNTIVIITADHGEAFNDKKLGYWSHGTAYTPFQLKVPLLIRWPNTQPRLMNYYTTNMDVVPTLLRREFRCRNPINDYSMGRPLLRAGKRPYLIAGSYDDYAVVTPTRVTRIYPGGDYVLNNRDGYHLNRAELDGKSLRKAFKDLNRFFAEPSNTTSKKSRR